MDYIVWNKFRSMWRELDMVSLQYYSYIFLGWLNKFKQKEICSNLLQKAQNRKKMSWSVLSLMVVRLVSVCNPANMHQEFLLKIWLSNVQKYSYFQNYIRVWEGDNSEFVPEGHAISQIFLSESCLVSEICWSQIGWSTEFFAVSLC